MIATPWNVEGVEAPGKEWTVNKVWLVWRGSYSDVAVMGVYDREDGANAAITWLNSHGGDAWISGPYHINPEYPEIPKGHLVWDVTVYPDGDLDVYSFSFSLEIGDIDSVIQPRTDPKSGNDWFTFKVWARDEDHARKIGQDKIAQFKAEREGIA